MKREFFGTWKVTLNRIEAFLGMSYQFWIHEFFKENGDLDPGMVYHVAGKPWVNIDDFLNAYKWSILEHPRTIIEDYYKTPLLEEIDYICFKARKISALAKTHEERNKRREGNLLLDKFELEEKVKNPFPNMQNFTS